ncbi:MAG: imidazole glycerol phosphate synthase subunit HisH [Magnetococcales bacterium]|nr:imidazole glycerol phosphate synthase subunit HisH [Magnetococcales bacterium]
MSVCIIDYGIGNLGSVRRAFEECDAHELFISRDPKDLAHAAHVVLPGVGAFRDGMQLLKNAGWVEPIRKATLEDGVPLLGICLGMQLLATTGSEGGDVPGLDLIPGRVVRMTPTADDERIPHVGWNEVHPVDHTHPLLENIHAGSDFYFVHSFHMVPDQAKHAAATTPYCGGITSVLARDTIVGTQFHPEKSSRFGFQLIRNFLAM